MRIYEFSILTMPFITKLGLFRREAMPVTRALSIRQPFAELIMVGKKKFEYRSIPTNIRERVYVYASKKSGPEKRWNEIGYERGSLPTGVLELSKLLAARTGPKGMHGS
jgi:hypothetical protein